MHTGKIVLIVNPGAGDGSDLEVIGDWADARPGATVRRTREGGDAERFAREAVDAGASLVVAAGGDGTIREVARGLVGGASETRDRRGLRPGEPDLPTLGILPLGTGNDLARSLEIPLRIGEALELLDRGERRLMDVVSLTLDGAPAPFYLNALTGGFSGGLHGTIDGETKAAWGSLSYLRSGVEAWKDRSVYPIEMEVDGKRTQHRALNLIIGNGSSAGGGMPVALGADPFDGLLEVVVFLDASGLELSGLAARLFAGGDDDHPALVRLQGRSVRVRTGGELLPVSIDGEPGEAADLSIEVLPGKLPVLVPPRSIQGQAG
ncbi:MAG: diacylglycerol kinase family lipid kinase [Gemmatimonadales bacterium]|nr:MAG: diacylglycerol kinase family lipid kinase [Gemmatimonadales bacterium]